MLKKILKKPKKLLFLSLPILTYLLIKTLNSPCQNYQCLQFPDKKNWQLAKTQKNSPKIYKALLSHPDYKLQLETLFNLPQNSAKEFTQIRLTQIKGFFSKARSPYPGVISDEIACETKYTPQTKHLTTQSGIQITYLSSFLTQRKQYGACINSQIKYTTQTAFFYCPSTKQWFQLEFIQPWDQKTFKPQNQEILEKLNHISCKKPKLKIPSLF